MKFREWLEANKDANWFNYEHMVVRLDGKVIEDSYCNTYADALHYLGKELLDATFVDNWPIDRDVWFTKWDARPVYKIYPEVVDLHS